ncbi:putative Methyl-accepting chemotaxis protein [Hyella patelloides LEGE 07179]|uniref:Putative Methyl-accepting chemotaxis protein n=1 Tax=Hyella patelloides LEGE 07179 TaxID=945734 RepID=A0A563W5L6_9CYAN|nr:methyl-accepting chemotaxis protein [Hyella patelloides]VEP18976.1 putative Methyl-accepting chemotaxis protein [Hyella patelloides LEGE 07179]
MKLPLSQSLRFRFPLYVILGVVSPVLVGITLAGSLASNTIASNTEDTLRLEAKSLKNAVEQWIQMNVLAVQNLSKQPDIASLNPQQQTKFLKAITNSYPHIYTASIINADGNGIARSDGKALDNYSDRAWFKEAQAGNDIAYQSLISSTSKKPAVCFAAPIRQVKSVIAIANICNNLTQVIEQVGATTIGNTGYALVVDRLGQVIAHPDVAMISGDSLVNLSSFPPVQNLLAGNQSDFTFQDDTGKTWISQGKRLDNGWGVIVLQETAEANTPAKKLQQLDILIGLLTIVFAGGITWLLVSRLIEPLQKMTQVANQMSQGNLEQKILITSQDELGILANSLNTMAKQLQEAFTQLETQYEDRAAQLLDSQKLSKEKQLQQRIQSLQQEIAPVSQGDLTARAVVTEDEIGAVANSYNQTLENLSQIILQVQDVTKTVASTTNRNEEEVTQLSADALQQTQEIASVLDQVQKMAQSMRLVANNAAKAEDSIKQAQEKVQKGDSAINATVERIVSLGESTTIAKEQVQKLGKASHKISKAVDLIRKIALQTNVLAVNASIEAARAGEEGMGFTVVADEVQSLAARSAKTASDIEKLVLEIQGETQKTIKVMEQNSQEIMVGSKLMKETRLSLQQITEASSEIDLLIEDITKVATEQSENSQTVTATMEEVAAIANKTSVSATDVSTSFKELLQVSEQLEASINQFKVK